MKTRVCFLVLAIVLGVSRPALCNDYKPKQTSRFDCMQNNRSPFWPIGHFRNGGDKADSGGAIGLNPADFKVTSIFLGGLPRMALINGKDYSEGQTVTVHVGQQQAKVILMTVFDGGVILQRQGEKLVVPLRRL